MQHDLTDSVRWAIDQGIADPDKICIFGGSYGGYACLAGLTFTPDLYKCGVDIVGPSNIKTLLDSIPAYWGPLRNDMLLKIGDVTLTLTLTLSTTTPTSTVRSRRSSTSTPSRRPCSSARG